MKTILCLLTLALFCISINCVAQESKFLKQEIDSLGNISSVTLNTEISPQSMSQAAELLKNIYSMRKTDEFRPSKERKEIQDKQGLIHQYYQQYYKNIKVEYGEATVHSDKQGNIETVFGYFKPVGDVDVTPSLSETQALEHALKHIGAETYKWQIPEEEQWIKEYYNSTYRPVGELVIIKDRLKTDRIYRLAYHFDIYAHKPMSRNYIWVDAITGDILDIESRIRFANANGTAATRYSGARPITTDSYSGRYRLRETRNGVNISTFNMNHTGTYSSTDFTDNDNNWTTIEHSVSNNNAALDAHWGTEMVYEYFKQVHGRNSWNDAGAPLLSYVNANLPLISYSYSNSDNAFWDGNRMVYGQGSSLPPLTTLDVCAHEIGHGICDAEAGLVYSGQSGAIDESLSDIWAACIEEWATNNKQTWLLGEDLGNVGRSMSNPNAFGQPDTYGGTNWWHPADLSWDNGGVHRNSGVMNFWFYLLSMGGSGTNDLGNYYNFAGIGMDKAAEIVYETETSYMIATETFWHARTHTIKASVDMYGFCSPEAIAVTNAWYAVGVGNAFVYPSNTLNIVSRAFYPGTTTTKENVNIINVSGATTVKSGATLILDACSKTTINPNFKIEAGASFTIR